MKSVFVQRRLDRNSELSSLFLVLVFVSLLVNISACEQTSQTSVHVISGTTMGTNFEVSLVASVEFDVTPIKQGVDKVLSNINQSMSTYIANSEVSIINQSAADIVIPISQNLRMVLEEAQTISAQTGGAFDITVGAAVDLWGFGPDGSSGQQPSELQLSSLANSVGFDKLIIDAAGVKKLDDGTRIDLSAIAKGFAVDKVAEYLAQAGLSDFLVNIGGELKARGMRADGTPWKIGIEKPFIVGGVQRVIELNNQAIATSGDYRNFSVIDGKKFSHTIDSRTLRPVFHKLASVTVVSENASTADALATALLAMGEDRALEYSNRNALRSYLIVRNDEDQNFKVLFSDEFNQLLP